MKITEIIRDMRTIIGDTIPHSFTVGQPAISGGVRVQEILYCKNGYSGGAKGQEPCYAIKFYDTDEVRVIPEHVIVDIAIDPERGKTPSKQEETETLNLPE